MERGRGQIITVDMLQAGGLRQLRITEILPIDFRVASTFSSTTLFAQNIEKINQENAVSASRVENDKYIYK